MENNQTPIFLKRRALGTARRATVDGIATHCGFIPRPCYALPLSDKMKRHCDDFFAKRNMVWVSAVSDYLPRDAALAAIQTLGGVTHLFA